MQSQMSDKIEMLKNMVKSWDFLTPKLEDHLNII